MIGTNVTNTNAPPVFAVSKNGISTYTLNSIELEKNITLDMVKEAIQNSYLYSSLEEISYKILYTKSGKPNPKYEDSRKRRLIVTLVRSNECYYIVKAFWKRNLHFIGTSKNSYKVYFAKHFFCNIDIDILAKMISRIDLSEENQNYRFFTTQKKKPFGYVDYVALSYYEDYDDLIYVIRKGEPHPVGTTFANFTPIFYLSIHFSRKSDIDGTYYVIDNIIFTGLEVPQRPWEIDPYVDTAEYLYSMKFWEKHAYCFIPQIIQKFV